MKKLHVLYAALFVGAVVALAVLNGSQRAPQDDERAKRSNPTPPGMNEVGPARPPKVRLFGTVRRSDGTPIKGATVFVLAKTRRGGIRDMLTHEVSDAMGRWALRARGVEESWVGVVAAGYRHAWLDGASVAEGQALEHTLQRAPALRVTLLDEAGRPIAKKGVQLEPWPPRTTYFLPGPAARQGEQWKVTGADGTVTFRVGDEGAVTLRPHVEGRHAVDGSATWLEKAEGDVTLRLRPSLSLHLRLTAAETREAIDSLVTVDLHDRISGRLALSHTDSPDANGLLRLDRSIRPGLYDVHVHGEGLASVVLPGLALDGRTEPNVVSARLGAAVAPGTVRLELGSKAAGAGGRRRAPLVFLFRPAGAWRSHGWQRAAPESWNPDDGSLVLQLPPDRYHALVADVLTRRATLVRDVDVSTGSHLELKVALRPGLRTAVNALIAARGRTRTVEVTSADLGALPVYGITRDGRIRVSRAVDVLARVEEGASIYLGPYPVDRVTIRVTGWDGAIVTHDVTK